MQEVTAQRVESMTEELNQSNQTENEEDLSFAELFEMEENNKVVAVGDVAIGTIIAFLIFQRQFVANFMRAGIK